MTRHRAFLGGLLTILALAVWPGGRLVAQGPGLIQPIMGSPKVNCYLDHQCPYYSSDSRCNGSYDGKILQYSGAHTLNVASSGQPWAGTYSYEGHSGTDYSAASGTPILAADSGTVSLLHQQTTGYGYHLYLDHGNGRRTLYAHLSGFNVIAGQHVARGEVIAYSGNTGNSTGPHLHFEVQLNGQPTDPYGWYGPGADPLSGVTGNPASQNRWAAQGYVSLVVEEGDPTLYTGYVAPSASYWDRGGYSLSRYWRGVITSGTTGLVTGTWYPDRATSSRRPLLDGPYAVYAWIPSNHATTENALYAVKYRDGYVTIAIDQAGYSNEWVSLGSFFFTGRLNPEYPTQYVRLNNRTGESMNSREIGFDAIRFVQFRNFVPAVLKW